MKGVFTTANDTNVGKTWIGTQLVEELKRLKISVKARKPIESGWPDSDELITTDAWKLANAMGEIETLETVCPNRFSAALSPDRAAMLEGKEVTLEQLKNDCIKKVEDTDFLYVEGAGGFYSPIASDGLNAHLAELLGLPILLVIENRLGCINQALLNVEAIASRGLSLSAIALNQANHNTAIESMDNLSDIQQRVNCPVIPFGYQQSKNDSIKKLAKIVLAS